MIALKWFIIALAIFTYFLGVSSFILHRRVKRDISRIEPEPLDVWIGLVWPLLLLWRAAKYLTKLMWQGIILAALMFGLRLKKWEEP